MPISPQPIKRYLPNFENNLPTYFLLSKQNSRRICACMHAWEHQVWLCMHKNCMSTITHDKCSCMHAHDRIVRNISLENRKYVGGLSLKFDKALFMSCWEICLSLAMHFYLQIFYVFSAIFQLQGAKHANCWKLRQSIRHLWKPNIKMSQFERENYVFFGQYS